MGTGWQPGTLLAIFDSSKALWGYILPVAIIVGITIAGRIVEYVLLHRLSTLTSKSIWHGNHLITRSLRHKITIWGLLLGVTVALNYLPWQPAPQDLDSARQLLLVGFLATLTMLAADLAGGLLQFSQRSEAHSAVSIVDTIVRVTIYVVGAMIILQQVFKVNLTPALAALGVTGLAVSLALQATLTDLISGIQIIVARQVRPGEYIRLSTGEEGYVTDISWRTTTIRQLSNNLIIVPNSKMTSNILVNYHVPDASLSVVIAVGVSYDSDLEKVERVTLEVARDILATAPGAVSDTEPSLRFNTLGDSSIGFSVILKCKEYTDQYLIRHEFIKRLHKRYQEEGIEIPFPVRTVRLQHIDVADGLSSEPVPASNRLSTSR